MDNLTGKIVDSRYELQELVGVGGMAIVYKAYDRIDDRIVSLKILKDEFLENKDFVRRFKNESQAIAILDHPNIVKIYDVSFGDKMQYITMEYIDGITLKEYISRQGTISYKETVYFVSQILSGLSHAHQKGIIHRDIKPQNIMLQSDGTIKITDFGIARLASKQTITVSDKAIGSVHYISPEQAKGIVIDERADIYSLGILMYELLTGKLPFDSNSTVSIAIMQLQNEAKNPKEINPEIPDGLVQIVQKAMKKSASQRFKSADEMLKAINMFKQNPTMVFDFKFYDEEDNKKTQYVTVAKSKTENNHNDFNSKPQEYASKKERVSVVSIITGAAAAFVLVAVVVLSFLFVDSFTMDEPVPEVDLPNFVGMSYDEVIAQYDETFDFTVTYISSSEAEIGTITKQTPKGGDKKVKIHSEVAINVVSEEEYFKIPDIFGLALDVAIVELEKGNLTYNVVDVYNEEVATGLIVGTSPSIGAQVKEHSEITIYISQGMEDTALPVGLYKNKTFEEATDLVLADGFKVGEPIYKDSEFPKDYVIDQEPAVGSRLEKGEAVVLVLSTGVAPPPTVNSLEINIPLPKVANDDLVMYIDVYSATGEKVQSIQKIFNTSMTSNYLLNISGSDNGTKVVVKLKNEKFSNTQEYKTYKVNFENQTFATESEHTFKDDSFVESSEPPVSSEPPAPSKAPEVPSKAPDVSSQAPAPSKEPEPTTSEAPKE